MNALWLYLLLGGLVIAGLIWVIWKFLPWIKLLRKGVLVEGRIEAHKSRSKTTLRGTPTGGTLVGSILNIVPKTQRYLLLVYSYECNEAKYFHEEVVDTRTYSELKDGDRVKVRCLLEDPTTAELVAPAFETFLRRLMNTGGVPVDSNEIFPEKWKGD